MKLVDTAVDRANVNDAVDNVEVKVVEKRQQDAQAEPFLSQPSTEKPKQKKERKKGKGNYQVIKEGGKTFRTCREV